MPKHNLTPEKLRESLTPMMYFDLARLIKKYRVIKSNSFKDISTKVSKIYMGLLINPDNEIDGEILCDTAREFLNETKRKWHL